MRLADFIERRTPTILEQWDAFAAELMPARRGVDASTLRDHAAAMLEAIAADLRTNQTRDDQRKKSLGLSPPPARETAAQAHAVLRAARGFGVRQLVAEYRALRASVLRLWLDEAPAAATTVDDMVRFNEAIDQAIAESVDFYTQEVERWRDLFIGALGHDLRGPLNAVLLTAELIASDRSASVASAHADRLVRAGRRMRELLDDLLDYSRSSLEAGLPVQRAPLDLAAVCADEVDLLRAALPDARIELTSPPSCPGSWDASRVRQVLSNLVGNAAKYGAAGGLVEVQLERADGHARISVSNGGPAIPPALMDAMFEPLKRGLAAGDERSHLGLGLYIVRQVVAAHGGSVEVHSVDGRTTFTATLPA
jgi:signal transduction histidine kinase